MKKYGEILLKKDEWVLHDKARRELEALTRDRRKYLNRIDLDKECGCIPQYRWSMAVYEEIAGESFSRGNSDCEGRAVGDYVEISPDAASRLKAYLDKYRGLTPEELRLKEEESRKLVAETRARGYEVHEYIKGRWEPSPYDDLFAESVTVGDSPCRYWHYRDGDGLYHLYDGAIELTDGAKAKSVKVWEHGDWAYEDTSGLWHLYHRGVELTAGVKAHHVYRDKRGWWRYDDTDGLRHIYDSRGVELTAGVKAVRGIVYSDGTSWRYEDTDGKLHVYRDGVEITRETRRQETPQPDCELYDASGDKVYKGFGRVDIFVGDSGFSEVIYDGLQEGEDKKEFLQGLIKDRLIKIVDGVMEVADEHDTIKVQRAYDSHWLYIRGELD